MTRILLHAVLAGIVQIVAVVSTFFASTLLGTDLPLLAIVYIYFPTIFLVQVTGNFVGCANMIEPFLLGVLLGVTLYGLIASSIIRVIRRPGTST